MAEYPKAPFQKRKSRSIMEKTFCFTLREEEYQEYLVYEIIRSGKMRGSRWFLLTSVPALLVTGVLVLKIQHMFFITSVLALAVLWILYGAKAVWGNYLNRKVRRYYWPKLKVREFAEIRCHFQEKTVLVEEPSGKREVPYSQIRTMIPLKNMFAFYYPGGTLLLPYREFEKEEDMKAFLTWVLSRR